MKMIYKVHWIVDGVAEIEADSKEDAEKKLQESLEDYVKNSKPLMDKFYAKSIQDYKFEVQYKPGDIVLHTEFSLHKSRNMPKTEHRIMYARYVAKLIKNHQTKVRINNKIN